MKTLRPIIISALALASNALFAENVTLTNPSTVNWDAALWVVDGVEQAAGYVPSATADVTITNATANQSVRPNVTNYTDTDTGIKYLVMNSLTHNTAAGWVEVQPHGNFSNGGNKITQPGVMKITTDFVKEGGNFICYNSRGTGTAFDIGGNIELKGGEIRFGGSNANNMGGVTGLSYLAVGGNVNMANGTTLKISTINGQVLDAAGNQTGVANAVINGTVNMEGNALLSINDDATNSATVYGNATTVGSAVNQIVKVGGLSSTSAGARITTTTGNDTISGTHEYLGTLEISGSGNYSYAGQIYDKSNVNSAAKVSVIMNSADGKGVQILSGSNTYTGDTVIKSGTLLMGSISSQSKVVLEGGAFGSTGTASLTLGTVEWSGGGFAFDLSAASYKLSINEITGTLDASYLSDFVFTSITEGTMYDLIDLVSANQSFMDAFDGKKAVFKDSDNKWYEGTFTATENGLSVSFTPYVPEPSTYAAIFGVAALAFAACRRRK